MGLLLAFIGGIALAPQIHNVLSLNIMALVLLGSSGFCWIVCVCMSIIQIRGFEQPKSGHGSAVPLRGPCAATCSQYPWFSTSALSKAMVLHGFVTRQKRLKSRVFQLGLVGLACALGLMLWQSAYHYATRWQLPQTLAAPLNVTLDATILGLPAVKPHGTEVTVAVSPKHLVAATELGLSSLPGKIHLRLQWYQLTMPLAPGQRWRLHMRLRPLHGFQNPGNFVYVDWLLQQDIQAVGSIMAASPLPPKRTTPLATRVDDLRAKLRHSQVVSLPVSPLVGVLTALCLGDKSLVSPQVQQVFIKTGTAHLLAISGLHIGLVAGLVWLLGQRLWRLWPRCCLWLPARTVGLCMGVMAAWGYALLAGLAVSTQRAALMVSFAAFALGCQRKLAWSWVWVLTLTWVLIISPLSVTSSGLWLSFAAVLALSYLGLHPKRYVERASEGEAIMNPKRSPLRQDSELPDGQSGAGVTHAICSFMVDRYRYQLYPWLWLQVSLTLLLAPLMLALFHQVSMAAVPANLLAIPWIGTVIVPMVLVGTLLQQVWPWAGHALLSVSLHLLTWFWPVLTWLANVPYVTWAGGVSTLTALFLGLWATAWLLAPHAVPWRQLGFGLLLPAWLNPGVTPLWGGVNMTVLDVGQGLATVIRTQKHTLIYDTGPGDPAGFNAGTAVIVPFLRDQGVNRVDHVVLSHGDNDHIAGLPALSQAYGQIPVLTSAPIRIRQVLHLSSSYPMEQCLAGMHWRWEGVDFAVRYPSAQNLGLDNNSSCVLQVSAGGKSLLLTGDIETPAEQSLLKQAVQPLASTVLVVPHHGSAGAAWPQFIMTIAPKYAIFATGYMNRFHFPRPRVLESYQAVPSQIFNTAYDGAVNVTISPKGQMAVTTYVPRT